MSLTSGDTVVITGATSGIGQVAAEALARQGARIVQIARSRQRGAAAMERLRQMSGRADHAVYYADLSLMAETRRVGQEIARAEPRIAVLLNNAGALFGRRMVTREGLEMTFALNHMSYFVLTQTLLANLKAYGPARVVSTSSDAHQVAPLDFNDMQAERAYQTSWWERLRYGGSGFRVYGRSKLCNILFTRELARRLKTTEVTANCLHPGFVATRFGDEAGGFTTFAIGIAKRFALSTEQGAKTMIYLASAQEVAAVSGQYFHNQQVAPVSAAAQDEASARRLWTMSEQLLDATGQLP